MSSFTVVPFEPRFSGAFKRINLSWISELFRVEPHDEATLADPAALVRAGGHIFVAVTDAADAAADDDDDDDDDARVLGVCALLSPAAAGEAAGAGLELAKMGVRHSARGRGVGRALGEAAVALARRLRVPFVDILSNRSLVPALTLYASLGFVERPMPPNDYERADIYLFLDLASESGEQGRASGGAGAQP